MSGTKRPFAGVDSSDDEGNAGEGPTFTSAAGGSAGGGGGGWRAPGNAAAAAGPIATNSEKVEELRAILSALTSALIEDTKTTDMQARVNAVKLLEAFRDFTCTACEAARTRLQDPSISGRDYWGLRVRQRLSAKKAAWAAASEGGRGSTPPPPQLDVYTSGGESDDDDTPSLPDVASPPSSHRSSSHAGGGAGGAGWGLLGSHLDDDHDEAQQWAREHFNPDDFRGV